MTSLSSVLFILTGASGLLPKIELWVDMRTTLRAPGEALEELYHGVVKELKSTGGTPPSGSISGVVVWHDPKSEWPEGLGDLPVVAVDPGGNEVSTLVSVPIVWTRGRSETQARAPSSTATMGDPLVLEPPFSSEAVANIEAGSCVIVDGARPDVWDESTLP